MRTSKRPSRAKRTDAARRAQLLAAFVRSGLSAAFARQQHLHYTTFCVKFVFGRLPAPRGAFKRVLVSYTHSLFSPACGSSVWRLSYQSRLSAQPLSRRAVTTSRDATDTIHGFFS
jgi:hypothetical protein